MNNNGSYDVFDALDIDDISEIFNKLKLILKDTNIIPISQPLDRTVINYIYFIIDINQKFNTFLIFLKEIIKIEDPTMYKYFIKLYEESLHSINSIEMIYDIDWSKISFCSNLQKFVSYDCLLYKYKENHHMLFVFKNTDEHIKLNMEIIEYWYTIFLHFQSNIENIKKDISVLLKFWYSVQKIFTLLHYQLYIYTDLDVINKLYLQLCKSPEFHLYNGNFYIYSKLPITKFRKEEFKSEQINFKVINKLNIYLKQMIDSNISIKSIFKLNDGTSSTLNYTDNIIINNNYNYITQETINNNCAQSHD